MHRTNEVNVDKQATFHADTMLVPPVEETPDSPEASSGFDSELNNTIVEELVAEDQGLVLNQDPDPDSSQDLEVASQSVGTEWVDATEELSEGSETSKEDSELNPVSAGLLKSQDTWAQVVSRKDHKSMTNKVRPADFVMTHKEGSDLSLHCGMPYSLRGGGGGLHGAATGKQKDTNESGVYNGGLNLSGPEVLHKAVVELIFLAYNRVSTGVRVSLIQITTAVAQSVRNDQSVDAIQPIKTGWWIHLRTSADCAKLVELGITLNSKHISLQVDSRPGFKKTVHITIKDLPLHTIDNMTVLEAVSANFPVVSDIQYATI